MVHAAIRNLCLDTCLSVLALSSRFDGRYTFSVKEIEEMSFSTRSVESF